jgi:TDG/mug DNA glycosylase family protein
MPKSSGLKAAARSDAHVLILGSLPGRVSLERGEYYAHPRNAFWPVMERLFGVSRDQSYAVRIHRLKERGIALWDVCDSASRSGSLDSTITGVVVNDLGSFLSRYSHVRLICFNGTKAEEIFRRKVLPDLASKFVGIHREVLPCTAPTCTKSFEEKLKRWKEALDFTARAVTAA